jgi:hypothetical protein
VSDRSHITRKLLSGALLLAFLAIGLLGADRSAVASIAYVQSGATDPNSSSVSSLTTTFSAAQAAGDLNVVAVSWGSSSVTVSSITDSKGNSYTLAAGPTVYSSFGVTSSIYYAKNIVAAAAGANTVTVTFSAAVPYPDVRIAEYSGISTSSPLDVTAAATGSGTLSSSGSMTTTNANDLLVAANAVATTTTGPGTGFTQRVISGYDGDILEDEIVSATGAYTATAPMSPTGQWIMQVAAFKAATGSDTTPPTAPTGLTAAAASRSQINLSWTASTDNVGVTGYKVERCQGASCTTFAQIGTPTATTYSDTGLIASTSYSYRVRATDAAGNLSAYSSTASATTPAASGGPVGWWKLDEGSGTTAADSSGQANTGTLTHSPTWSVGRVGPYAVTFGGNTSEVAVGAGSSLGNLHNSGLTVSAWINPTGSGGRIVDKNNNDVGWLFGLSGTTTLVFTTGEDTSGGTTLNSSTSIASITANVWQHVLATWDGSAGMSHVHLYINGVQADGTGSSGTGPEQDDAGTPLTIGNRQVDSAKGFTGAIDDVRVYNRVLSSAEIQTLADATSPSAPASLSASVASSSQINLSWTASTDNVGVTGYLIERCSGSGCSNFVQVATSTTTTYSNTGLSSGTAYSYRVRATDANSNLSGWLLEHVECHDLRGRRGRHDAAEHADRVVRDRHLEHSGQSQLDGVHRQCRSDRLPPRALSGLWLHELQPSWHTDGHHVQRHGAQPFYELQLSRTGIGCGRQSQRLFRYLHGGDNRCACAAIGARRGGKLKQRSRSGVVRCGRWFRHDRVSNRTVQRCQLRQLRTDRHILEHELRQRRSVAQHQLQLPGARQRRCR